MTLWCHAWGFKPPQIASHIDVICIQSILASYYAMEGHMGAPLTLLRLCRWEWISRKIGAVQSLSNVVMSWLRLQTLTDCIPQPNHLYKKYLSILLSCGWAYGSARTLLLLCQVGYDFGKIRVWLSPSDVVRSCLRLQNHLECIQHPFIICIKSVLLPWYAVDGHIGLPLHCYAGAGWEWV